MFLFMLSAFGGVPRGAGQDQGHAAWGWQDQLKTFLRESIADKERNAPGAVVGYDKKETRGRSPGFRCGALSSLLTARPQFLRAELSFICRELSRCNRSPSPGI